MIPYKLLIPHAIEIFTDSPIGCVGENCRQPAIWAFGLIVERSTAGSRIIHPTKNENEAIGPLASPKVFAFITIEGVQMNRLNRDRFDEYHGLASNIF